MNSVTIDERQAILRLRNGDIGGLAVLVEIYQVKAIRTAYLITQDQALAEDIVQDVFVRVFKRIEQYDVTRPFAPWFMRIVANDSVKAIKRKQRQVSLNTTLSINNDVAFLDLLPDTTASPHEQVEERELKQHVEDALKELSPEQRKAVVLRYYLGMSEKEMADEMNIPRGTVKWRLSAARKVLRAVLPRVFNEKVAIG